MITLKELVKDDVIRGLIRDARIKIAFEDDYPINTLDDAMHYSRAITYYCLLEELILSKTIEDCEQLYRNYFGKKRGIENIALKLIWAKEQSRADELAAKWSERYKSMIERRVNAAEKDPNTSIKARYIIRVLCELEENPINEDDEQFDIMINLIERFIENEGIKI